jgi:hypothetical protein
MLSQPQGPSVAGRIKSMKNPNDPIGNQTHDLPTCSTVPQPSCHCKFKLCNHTQLIHVVHLLTLEIVKKIWFYFYQHAHNITRSGLPVSQQMQLSRFSLSWIHKTYFPLHEFKHLPLCYYWEYKTKKCGIGADTKTIKFVFKLYKNWKTSSKVYTS